MNQNAPFVCICGRGSVRSIASIALCGCATANPFPANEVVDPPPNAQYAARIVADLWEAQLGIDIEEIPPIVWFEPSERGCLEYPYQDSDRCIKGYCYYGDISGPSEIHLALWGGFPSDSLLAHELLHWTLKQYIGHGDNDHNRIEWTITDDVTEVIRFYGY